MILNTKQEALNFKDEIVIRIDDLAQTASDSTYTSLINLQSAVITDINRRIIDLPAVLNHTNQTTLPALVLAHRLLNDAGKEKLLISNNRIKHPGFIPGGESLEYTQ